MARSAPGTSITYPAAPYILPSASYAGKIRARARSITQQRNCRGKSADHRTLRTKGTLLAATSSTREVFAGCHSSADATCSEPAGQQARTQACRGIRHAAAPRRHCGCGRASCRAHPLRRYRRVIVPREPHAARVRAQRVALIAQVHERGDGCARVLVRQVRDVPAHRLCVCARACRPSRASHPGGHEYVALTTPRCRCCSVHRRAPLPPRATQTGGS
jgi:hypothetical protein